jgi:hypothetical protein
MKRLALATSQRDQVAFLGLYSRSMTGTWRNLKGDTGKCNYDCTERSVNMVFDGADVAETYDCKAAPASAPQRGALACTGRGNVIFAGRTIKTGFDKTLEFGVENGEVKIVFTKTIQTLDPEVKR